MLRLGMILFAHFGHPARPAGHPRAPTSPTAWCAADRRETAARPGFKTPPSLVTLVRPTSHVVGREMDVVRSQLSRNRVTILTGTGSFADPHTVTVDGMRQIARFS